eukprot:CAMPEP_0181301042 /NCGR_PEP_ID=MMETSP1101-20121128/7212_1 /TAXON_ID=46948 /ORGANISM="Rhodomonas abbreviata, Strain Caron Lab Isolate" /LENGTH=416 /DNA_ID=CAMNT_0023406319 /DNA_START=79 /DNA_END=1329 /DNA_ORIENTATION=-
MTTQFLFEEDFSVSDPVDRSDTSRRSSDSCSDLDENVLVGHDSENVALETKLSEVSDIMRLSLHLRGRAEEWQIRPDEIKTQEILGSGDCAVVYKARWRGMDIVAKKLKTVEEYAVGSPITASDAKAGLVNEIAILSHLRHPNLVLFLGACTEAGGLILLSEFMDGGNLEDFILRTRRKEGVSGRISMKTVLSFSQDLGQALCFLHNCNPKIIHRDLKPANLLLTQGRLKVADFGLSSVYHSTVTQNGYVMTGMTGSLRYMAPEVLNVDSQGKSTYNEKVDIYSAGMIMWFMCMGERPFGDLSGELVTVGTCKGLRPDVSSIQSRKGVVGAMMAAIVEKCWATNPDERLSGDELARAVKEARVALANRSSLTKTMKRFRHRFSTVAASTIRIFASSPEVSPVAEKDRPQHPSAVSA